MKKWDFILITESKEKKVINLKESEGFRLLTLSEWEYAAKGK